MKIYENKEKMIADINLGMYSELTEIWKHKNDFYVGCHRDYLGGTYVGICRYYMNDKTRKMTVKSHINMNRY